MSDNPYRLPVDDYGRVVSFSGGRSSAYMLYHILDAHDGQLPDSVVVCFANTGAEVEETLIFVKECGERWNVPIVWLEYRNFPDARGRVKGHEKHRHVVVNFETASRDKEPYEAMIAAKSMLPNIAMSFCTTQLKVNPINWYVTRDLGWGKLVRNVLGMRADEPRRVEKALFEECRTEYPMYYAGVTKRDVLAFWGRQDFDLGIHGDEGNCTLCFKKGRTLLVRLIREHPDWVDWWVQRETEREAQFSKRFTYQQLLDESKLPPSHTIQPDMLDEAIDCFCGD